MKLRTNLLAALAATSSLLVATASRTDADDLHIGCWDDQFTGNASAILYVTPETIVVSYPGWPSVHGIRSEYTSFFLTGNDAVDEQGVSFITSNSDGTFSDFDIMVDSSDDESDAIYYCQIDYNDPTAEEAAKEDPDIDYTDLEAGCGSSGFPWSVMRRTSEDACEGLIADDAEDDHDEDEDHDVDEDDHDGHDHGEDDHDHDDEGEHSEDGADDAEEGGEDPSGSATTYVGSKSIVFAAIALVGMIAV